MRRRPVLIACAGLATAALVVSACSDSTSGHPDHERDASPARASVGASSLSRSSTSAAPSSTSSRPSPAAPSRSAPRSTGASSTAAPSPSSPSASARHAPSTHRRGLPLALGTHDAQQVITVVADSHDDTSAQLQRWTRSAHGWRPVGSSVTANLGSDGMTRHPSESKSATPMGSFTLTTAFGHDSDPGTRLPYVHTTPDDWWISQPGPLYNTRQRCSSHCGFSRGDPNEHLYYETPAYDYAVVIDYNTANAPGGVQQGAGSAFFLHVSEGEPTAGCVSIPVDQLRSVMRWLRPSQHPRILIGVR